MRNVTLALTLALVSALPATARAADVKAEADQVNTLNGQLVEVGDRNRYLLSYKPWNIGTNPVAWMYGAFSISAARAVSDIAALRLEGEFLQGYLGIGDFNGWGGVFASPLYFKKMYDGFFVEPGFRFQRFDTKAGGLSYYGPQVLAGWHWMWDSGMNVSWAFGVGRIWGSDSSGTEAKVEGILPAGFIRVGYAFE